MVEGSSCCVMATAQCEESAMKTKGNKICSQIPQSPMYNLFASQFQPQASPQEHPGHLKKLFKCLALQSIFVGKCPKIIGCHF